jgi:hypothetical protein
MKRYNLAPGDFPDIDIFRGKLAELDFTKFNSLKQRLIDDVEIALSQDLPRLMDALPRNNYSREPYTSAAYEPLKFDDPKPAVASIVTNPSILPSHVSPNSVASVPNPWEIENGDDDGDYDSNGWELVDHVRVHQSQFDSLQINGKISGAAAKPVLSSSGLPSSVLKKIWELSDIDKDGQLDLEEFVIAKVLIEKVKGGSEVPLKLDDAMIPRSKRV